METETPYCMAVQLSVHQTIALAAVHAIVSIFGWQPRDKQRCVQTSKAKQRASNRQGAFTKLCCHLQDLALLYLFALVLQCLIFTPYIIKAPQHGQDAKQVIWRLLDLIVFAIPAGLPLVLLLVGAVSQALLQKHGLLLPFPEVVRQGADIDIVCFDKTGTLTGSEVSGKRGLLVQSDPLSKCGSRAVKTKLHMQLIIGAVTHMKARHKQAYNHNRSRLHTELSPIYHITCLVAHPPSSLAHFAVAPSALSSQFPCITQSPDALQAALHGVLPVSKASFGPLQQSALRWSNRLKQMFAVCHSLNMVSKSAVAGDNVEVKLFKAVEASFLVCAWLCHLSLPG